MTGRSPKLPGAGGLRRSGARNTRGKPQKRAHQRLVKNLVAILSISEKELHSIARADRSPRCRVNRRLGPFHAHWAGVCTLPRYTTPSGLPSDAGKLSPARARLSPPVWIGAVVPCQKGFRRSNRRWGDALRQPRLRKLPVSGEPTLRMLRKLEYLAGIFVRRLAECFAVILDPIATMLLVNGHCEQSNLIPIVLNQSRPKGLTITPDEAVRLLMCEGRSNARHRAHPLQGRGPCIATATLPTIIVPETTSTT